MFGGFGVYIDGVMMGLIADDVAYFKTDDSNRGDYETLGTGPFMYAGKRGKPIAMSYHQVPDDVFEDTDELIAWAEKASIVAKKNSKKTKKPIRNRKRKPGDVEQSKWCGVTAASLDPLVEHLLDLLAGFGAAPRRMFGGTGLYKGDAMFGFAYDERVYFKVDRRNRADYENAGSEMLVYAPEKKAQQVASLMEVPADVLEDADDLALWAAKAVEAAIAARRGRTR